MNETDVPADTLPDAALPPRPGHGAKPLDDSVEEARWRDLPTATRPAAAKPLLPAAPRPRAGLRRRLRWWLFALVLAMLLGAALNVFAPEPPPCGDRLFIPSSEGGGGCVDPALLRR